MESKDSPSTGGKGDDEGKSGKGYSMLGGYYAKAKQRVLNRMGKRTTLTKNPRVDYISKRIDKIKHNKTAVAAKAEKMKQQLEELMETSKSLNQLMLQVWKEELGTRSWNEENEQFVRSFNADEKEVMTEIDKGFEAFNTDIGSVFETFQAALSDTVAKPLTHCSTEEEKRVKQIHATKEDYKHVRTLYSDAMIDYERECASGEPTQKTTDAVEEASTKYEEFSDRLTENALQFETLYREEVCQRIESHFLAINQLSRGVKSAVRDFYPYVKSFTFDAKEQHSAIQRQIEAAKLEADREDGLSKQVLSSLPKVPFGRSKHGTKPPSQSNKPGSSVATEELEDGYSNIRLDSSGRLETGAPQSMDVGSDDILMTGGAPQNNTVDDLLGDLHTGKSNTNRSTSDDVFGLDE